MKAPEVHELVERLATVDAACADRAVLAARLADTERLASWAESRRLVLASLMAGCASFPEDAIGTATRRSHREAARTLERSQVAEDVPALAVALADGAVSGCHLDALGDGLRRLEPHQRAEVDTDRLADVARRTTPDEFRRAVAQEVRRVQTDDGMARLEQQRRNTRLRSWTSRDGMVHLSGQFDPETGLKLLGRLRNEVERRFAEQTPETCPSDPFEKQDHLRALALVSLTEGSGPRSSLPEIIGVRDERCTGCPICSPSPPTAGHGGTSGRSAHGGRAEPPPGGTPAAFDPTTGRRGAGRHRPTNGDHPPGVAVPPSVDGPRSIGRSAFDDAPLPTPASGGPNTGAPAATTNCPTPTREDHLATTTNAATPTRDDQPSPATDRPTPKSHDQPPAPTDGPTPTRDDHPAASRQLPASEGPLPGRGRAATAVIDWGVDVELPDAVVDAIAARARHIEVVVRGGMVVSPTEGLDQGRTTRLANRVQRRVLRALYPTCAAPNCPVRYPSTRIHHVVWWEHGGVTDLDNLLPLCSRHHHAVHEGGWQLTLLPDRTLHIVLPDGTSMTTGPPTRAAR